VQDGIFCYAVNGLEFTRRELYQGGDAILLRTLLIIPQKTWDL
jgi:hypothetical protein